jgi:hypothetical protein
MVMLGYRLDNLGVESQQREEILLFSTVQSACGTDPACYVMGNRVLSQG